MKHDSGKLYCFSPPVMLATFVIEICLAIYTFWRYKPSLVRRLGMFILIALGVFQATEYMICGGLGFNHMAWARFGYVSITLLPALGIHMLAVLSGKKSSFLVTAAYATCLAFVGYYALNTAAISGNTCTANYAVFYSPSTAGKLFGIYYYGWLMTGVYLAWKWGAEMPKKRKQLYSMMLGYLVFLVPTTAFNLIDPTTMRGIPSIMCGFAVLLAFVLVAKVLPASCKVSQTSQEVVDKLQLRI